MRIHVKHIDDETVEITLTPGPLARLFGAKARRGIALREGCDGYDCKNSLNGTCLRWHWWWKATDLEVSKAITREIQCTTIDPVADALRELEAADARLERQISEVAS